jgi:hypothetical protein
MVIFIQQTNELADAYARAVQRLEADYGALADMSPVNRRYFEGIARNRAEMEIWVQAQYAEAE